MRKLCRQLCLSVMLALAASCSDELLVDVPMPTKLTFTVQPSNAMAGVAISPAVAVTIEDGSGNTVTSANDVVTVALDANPGGASLSGTTAVNAVNGVATFRNLSIDKASAGYTLTAYSGALTGATSVPFAIAPPTASLHVAAATTGADFDPDGYTVTVSGPGFWMSRNVAASETFAVAGLVPGYYSVTLSGMSINCDVGGPNPRTTTVAGGGTGVVAFDVSCAKAAVLAIVINGDIYWVKSNGTNLTQLTTHSAADSNPAWSPDGTKLAFTSGRDGNAEVYVMDAHGQNQVRLTSNDVDDFEPEWSPDGSKLAFTSWRDGNPEIYLMNADGSNPVRLTTDAGADLSPAWSPDGTKLAFSSSRDGNAEIYVMDVDGSNQVRLTSTNEDDLQPAWSPDGSKLVFSSSSYYGSALWVMNGDGSGAAPLTFQSSAFDPQSPQNPAWSPDGAWIAIGAEFRHCGGEDGDCYVYSAVHLVRADRSRIVELMQGATQPAWRR